MRLVHILGISLASLFTPGCTLLFDSAPPGSSGDGGPGGDGGAGDAADASTATERRKTDPNFVACSEGSIPTGTLRRIQVFLDLPGGQDLANFAVPVEVPADVLASLELETPQHLLFTDGDGNPLPHEVEVYNPEGESTFWVRPSSVGSGDCNSSLWLTATRDPNAQPVDPFAIWADNFLVGVWHFNKAQGDQPNSAQEALPLQQEVLGNASLQSGADIVGQAATGRYFLPPATGSFTGLEFSWEVRFRIQRDGTGSIPYLQRPIHQLGHFQLFATRSAVDVPPLSPEVLFRVTGSKADFHKLQATNVTMDDNWHYLAVTVCQFEGNQVTRLYLDGAEIASSQILDGAVFGDTNPSKNNFVVGLGVGQVDEVRVSRDCKAANRIAANHSLFENGVGFGTTDPVQ